MECYTYLRNIQDLLSEGKTPYERRFGEPFKGPIVPFGSLVEYYPIFCERPVRNPSIWKEILSGLFLGYALYAGWIWKCDITVADIEELETMDAQEIYPKRLNAKEVIFPKEIGKFIFPVADGRIKLSGGDQELRTPALIRDHPIRGESQRDFLWESERSPPPPPQDSLPNAGEAINDFWSMSGNFIYRHHVEPRVKLYSPREESFPIPLKYIDVSRTTRTNLDVMQENRIDDYLNIDGSRDLSDSWTGFNQFTLLEEKPPDGYMRSKERLTKRQVTSRPDHLWRELWTKLKRNAKLREKQKWSIEKPKLDNARRLRGIYFIDPENKEFKETKRNARKKLETPMAPAMPCKTSKKNKNWETRNKTNDFKCKFACILEASESTRMRLEESLPKYHEDHIAGRGDNCNITFWYTNLFLCLKQWRYPQQKQQWIKNGGNLKRFRRGTWQKSEKIRGDRWSKDEGHKSSFCLPDGHLSFEECRIGAKAPKIQRSSCTPRRHCERRFWVSCSIHWTRIISISNDSSKNHGYHIQTARMLGTSSWRSICLHPGENGRCINVIENSQIGMSRHLDTSTEAQMAKIMVQYGRPSRSSWAESPWSSFGRTVMGKAIWENPIDVRLGEGFPLIRTPWKRVILICVCGWHQIGWKETKHWSDVESTQQRSRFGRTNIFPWSCIPGMYSKTMWNKQRYCWQLQNHVWIQNFRRNNWTNYHARKFCVFLRGPTTWKVMPRHVWNDIVSFRTKRLNNSSKYQLLALTTIISKKKNFNPWENCQKYALKMS